MGSSLSLLVGAVSTVVFACRALPMLRNAAVTTDLVWYSLANIVTANIGNVHVTGGGQASLLLATAGNEPCWRSPSATCRVPAYVSGLGAQCRRWTGPADERGRGSIPMQN
jgi:hypothetical protein